MAAIRELPYIAAGRCYFQTRTRFWERDSLGPLGGLNLVGTATIAGRLWNTRSQQADPRPGMVQAYMFDTEALQVAAYGHRRVAATRKLAQKLHWMFPAMRQIEGRVHFAGEHTSLWFAWMNGALESAERVTAEVLRADGEPRLAAGLVA